MLKEMIISSNGHETMVAILEDDLVAEIFVERERQRGVVGNVYKGRVSKVLPGMQSSFIDVGLERDGFLYVADVVDTLEEFDRLEEPDELSYELAEGELVVMTKPRPLLNRIVAKLTFEIQDYLKTHPLGEVFNPENLFVLGPNTKRAPDVSFVRAERARHRSRNRRAEGRRRHRQWRRRCK